MKQKDNNRLIRLAVTPLLPMVLLGCSDELHVFRPDDGGSGLRFELQASIDQVCDTRADESGFADGDRFGLFVVNYSGGEPGELTLSANQGNNVAMTYNSDSNTWGASTDIYWRDPITPADVYGYYPFSNGISDVNAYSFEVKADQSVTGSEGTMGAYEASDLLWAKTSKATPGKKVELTFSHIMAGVKVVLQQGSGFNDDEWTKLEKTVTVDNTVRTSEIDLSEGKVSPTGSFDRNIVMNPEGDVWRAVVVPQPVVAGKSVIGITIDGKPYT
ncbi:MAG: fimbrillin family protein, partial [Muribaculaceae bacterium]|nr:fimbrillin family protein [Muribaculaceae bacterium]